MTRLKVISSALHVSVCVVERDPVVSLFFVDSFLLYIFHSKRLIP